MLFRSDTDFTNKGRPTKSGNKRAVVIPSVNKIKTGYNVREFLEKRCAEALEEQKEGKNPLALIFPNSHGEVIKYGTLATEIISPAVEALGWKMPGYPDANGKVKQLARFTIHSMRDRFGTTAADEWGYTPRQLLEQGSWKDVQTVNKFYLGTSDETYLSVQELHKPSKGGKKSRK